MKRVKNPLHLQFLRGSKSQTQNLNKTATDVSVFVQYSSCVRKDAENVEDEL